MKLTNDLTYDGAMQLIKEKRPDPSIMIDAKDAFSTAPSKIITDLFIKAQLSIKEHFKQDTKLTALDAFEKGILGKHAKKNSIADLL